MDISKIINEIINRINDKMVKISKVIDIRDFKSCMGLLVVCILFHFVFKFWNLNPKPKVDRDNRKNKVNNTNKNNRINKDNDVEL